MKIIRIIVLILALCFLVGCSQPTETPNSAETENEATGEPLGEPVKQFVFTRENFPIMDGSTSTVPLGEAIASVLLGETREEVSDLVKFNKTTNSYRGLIGKHSDILIAAEPAESIMEEKERKRINWKMEPIAVDGLVFMVNENNPVDSLTTEEIQAIYSGQITNWSQVGGDDVEIMPFQRNEDAGSQAAMLKHVMKDIPIMEAPKEYKYASMSGLIEGIAAYNDTAASIGYTMYYYAEDMNMADGLKLLKIDGVEPNDETIRSGEYPFLNNYYAVIWGNLTKDDPARVMYEWLLSEGGQRLVANEGYVSVMDVGADSGPLSGDIVKTDWSKLDTYDSKALYTYLEPRSKDGLLHPRDDYDPLLTYIGAIASDRYDSVIKYGLVTDKGQIVTEPVYSGINYVGQFMVLYQYELVEREYPDSDYVYRDTVTRYTFAAADGSWVKDLGICRSYTTLEEDVLIIFDTDGSMVAIDADGNVLSEFPASVFTDHFGEENSRYTPFTKNVDGYLCAYRNYEDPAADALIIDVYNGTVVGNYPKDRIVAKDTNTEYEASPQIDGYNDVYSYTDHLTGKRYYEGRQRLKGMEYKLRYDLLDENGNVIFSDFEVEYIRGGCASTIKDNYFCYYSIETGEPMFRFPIRVTND